MSSETNFMGFTNEIIDLATFVVKQNFNHHQDGKLPSDYYNDIISIYNEELIYNKNSQIFISKNIHGKTNGMIRVIKWNYIDSLPIQKIFGINPIEIVGNSPINHIWHIGRFATLKGTQNLHLFKKLMLAALTPVCQFHNSIVFAECDSKLLRIINLMGIKTIKIGKSIQYLGSETVPISIHFSGLIDFYKKNIRLLSNNSINSCNKFQKLHKSVVFEIC